MATYIDPRPSDSEIVEALRYHFPIAVQRALLTNQLNSIGDALDLLKRVEIMESDGGFQRPHNQPQSPNPNASRPNSQQARHDNRGQTQNRVRQIQYSRSRNRYNGNWRQNNNYRNYERDRNRESQGGSSGPLNPDVSPFTGRQGQTQANNPGNHSEN
jgi:hypothetical protein